MEVGQVVKVGGREFKVESVVETGEALRRELAQTRYILLCGKRGGRMMGVEFTNGRIDWSRF